jgi:aldose 1-epimerase
MSHVRLIALAAGPLAVELAPEIGGCVASFKLLCEKRWIDLMRPMEAASLRQRDATCAAMFPLVPYANRIASNRFEFAGRTHFFQPNFPRQPLNLHGSGWHSSWEPIQVTDTSARLVLDHHEASDPYSYVAEQHFKLAPNELAVRTTVRNTGSQSMPFGIGQHPFWPKGPETQLRFKATHFGVEGPEHLPIDCIDVPAPFDFSTGRELPHRWCNNDYGGWDGKAEIELLHLGVGIRIEADSIFGHVMLYNDPDASFFCLEPQTHVAGALNRLNDTAPEELGVTVLDPGGSLKGSVSYTWYPLSARA